MTPKDSDEMKYAVSELEIPIILQQDDYSCVPCCIKMVLEYLSLVYNTIPKFELHDISECIGTTDLGTPSGSNLDDINEMLIKCVPSIEFYRDNSYPRWDSIVNDLLDKRPAILWIQCQDQAGRYFEHSVVVIGYENRKVLYNDPIYGRQEELIDTFLPKWEEVDRFAIRLKVGERIERKITEYLEKENEGIKK